MTVIIGFQLVAFAFFTQAFAVAEDLLPGRAFRRIPLSRQPRVPVLKAIL